MNSLSLRTKCHSNYLQSTIPGKVYACFFGTQQMVVQRVQKLKNDEETSSNPPGGTSRSFFFVLQRNLFFSSNYKTHKKTFISQSIELFFPRVQRWVSVLVSHLASPNYCPHLLCLVYIFFRTAVRIKLQETSPVEVCSVPLKLIFHKIITKSIRI